jgi:ADP-heptose:LPS heptosyltransferase
MTLNKAMKILIIRRDNIGDLVCTTPLIHSIRTHFPEAEIYALVNSYNQIVLNRNPDLTAIYQYTKTKHRDSYISIFGILINRILMTLKLRTKRIDYAILAGDSYSRNALKSALLIKPKHIIGFSDKSDAKSSKIDLAIDPPNDNSLHETEIIQNLLGPLGIKEGPGKLRIFPDQDLLELYKRKIPANTVTIGLHISARKRSRQWPIEFFVKTIMETTHIENIHYAIFWSPGDENDPRHPGDDKKAEKLRHETSRLSNVTLIPTHSLDELISSLGVCNLLVCCDGGAVHIGAALNIPMVALFQNENKRSQWHPWKNKSISLISKTDEIKDIKPDLVIKSIEQLLTDK